MKRVIYKENYVFTHDAHYTSYPEFLQELKSAYKYIKKHNSDVKDEDIRVEFEGDFDYLPMKLTFAAFETDEEFKRRKDWNDFLENERKEKEITLMKEYIQSHKTEALEFINKLSKKLKL